jgi:flagellar hook-basal body complex protein FliE
VTAPIGLPDQFGALLRRDPQEGLTLGNAPTRGPAGAAREAPAIKQPDACSGIPGETPNVPNVVGPSFVDHLKGFVSGIDQTQKSAEHKAEEFAVGHQNDIHGTMIAVEQAEISLHLLANVRNRVVDLYREVMRMGS